MFLSDGYSVSLDESFVLQDSWDSISEIDSDEENSSSINNEVME